MIDITLQNFEADVLQASMQQPVLLDIWAPWCGPCRTLGPMLEKLEADYDGRFVLAKLNSDDQPEIAGQLSQMFGVRSIPFCVMFAGGQPVDGFVGALPQAQIQQFLDKHVPAEHALQAEEELLEAEEAAAAGDEEAALARLQEAVAIDPANDEARLEYIKQLLARGRVEEAKTAFLPVGAKASGPLADARVAAFAHYLAACEQAPRLLSPEALAQAVAANKRDFDARFQLAQHHFAAGRFTEAMDELLEIIMRDKKWQDELARRTYVAILEVMTRPAPKAAPAAKAGEARGTLEVAGKAVVQSSDPVLDQYRRKLSMALF